MPRTILIVDDDTEFRVTLREILQSDGYLVVEATNGVDALSMLDLIRPSLVLADERMPVMTGMELLRRINVTPLLADIPAVLMSGANEEARARALGFAWLKKPFDMAALLALVRAHCRNDQ